MHFTGANANIMQLTHRMFSRSSLKYFASLAFIFATFNHDFATDHTQPIQLQGILCSILHFMQALHKASR